MSRNSKILGWLRGSEDGEPDETPGEESGKGAEVPALVEAGAPPAPITIDTRAIYAAAGISKEECDRVERAQTLLRSLPSGGSPKVRRQIVEASLGAFGVATDKIVEAGRREAGALAAFIAQNKERAAAFAAEGATRVAALEAEVKRVRESTERRVADEETRSTLARGEMLAVEDVLDFFDQTDDEVVDSSELEEATQSRGAPAAAAAASEPVKSPVAPRPVPPPPRTSS